MDGPEVEVLGALAAQQAAVVVAIAFDRQRPGDLAGHLAGEVHVEAVVADPPGDGLGRVGDGGGPEVDQGHARLLGGDQGRSAAVAEQQHRQDLLDAGGGLEVQGAELQVHHQHPRGRLGANDVVGQAQGVDGGVAAHEADHGALHARVQPGVLDDQLIQARRHEAGAGGDDEVGDALALVLDAQGVDGPHGEAWSIGLETAHALGCRGGAAQGVEPLGVAHHPAILVGRLEVAEPVLDGCTLGHLGEHAPIARRRKRLVDESEEGGVNVMGRRGRPDPVDMGPGHAAFRIHVY